MITSLHNLRPIAGSLSWLSLLVVVAILAPVLSNDQPLACHCGETWYFPAFSPNKAITIANEASRPSRDIDWQKAPCASKLWPLLPFGNKSYDAGNQQDQPPLSRNSANRLHLLGTTRSSQDLLTMLIYGTRVSLLVGVFTALLTVSLGVGFGGIAGFFGNDRLRISRGEVIGYGLGLFLSWYYFFYLRFDALENEQAWWLLGELLFRLLATLAFTGGLGWAFGKMPGAFFGKNTALPLDSLVQKMMEVLQSIPSLVLILTVGAISGRNLWIMMLMLGCVSWVGVARLVRADVLRARESAYMEAGEVMGFGGWRLLFWHALPNALNTAWVALAMGIGSAITAESSLAFLGLVNSGNSWGSIFGSISGQEIISLWWVGVFPCLCIFFTVLSCNHISEFFRNRFDPRSGN